MFIFKKGRLLTIIFILTTCIVVYLTLWYGLYRVNLLSLMLTLILTLIYLLDAYTQAHFRKNSITAFLNFKHLFLIPALSFGLTLGSENAGWFALVVYCLLLIIKIIITMFFLKSDFIYALLAPTHLKYGLPFHHYIFNDRLDWEYFFKRNIKPEIIQLFYQSIQYHENIGMIVTIQLKKNLFRYHLLLNNNHQIEQ